MIQQQLSINIGLLGDGSSTTFVFAPSNLFELWLDAGYPANVYTPASSATINSVPTGWPAGTAAVDTYGNVTLTFGSAPPATFGYISLILTFAGSDTSSVTTNWTSSTAVNATAEITVLGTSSVSVAIITTGTVTAGTLAFQVSNDNVNWFSIQGGIPYSYGTNTSWASVLGNNIYQFSIAGFSFFRTQLTAAVTGSGTVTTVMEASTAIIANLLTVGQPFGNALHTTLDDAVGGNAVNTVVKGTQAARALGVQDLKDSGRTPVILYVDSIAGVTTEALVTMSITKSGSTTTATAYTVTTGKTFRIQSMFLSCRATSLVLVSARARLRSAATVSATSPVFCLSEASSLSATAGSSSAEAIPIPDGLEIAGGQQVGISQIATATTADVTVAIVGYEY